MFYYLLNLVMLGIVQGVSTLNMVVNETKMGEGYLAMPCQFNSDKFVTVWSTNSTSMSLKIFNLAGEALTGAISFQGGTQNQVNKQFNRGVASFQNRIEFVFCREFISSVVCSTVDNLGKELTNVTLANATFNTNNMISVATFKSGQFVVAWVDKDDAIQISLISAGQVNKTKSVKSRTSPALAILSSQNFVLVSNKGVDSEVNIFNTKLETIATIDILGASKADVVGLENGGFVVAWQQTDGKGLGIYASVYNNDGQQIVSKFQVNTFTDGDQAEVSIAQLSQNYNYIVAIYQSEKSRDGHKVNYFRVFDLQGKSVTSEIELSGNHGLSQIAIIGNKIFQATSLANLTITYSVHEFTELYCIKFNSLSIGQIGDIDRTNEEIAWEISKSNGYQLTCGIFIFDIEKNIKDVNLKQLALPCKAGELINLRFVELDICNDDLALIQIECKTTIMNLKIQINPDSTITKTSSCNSLSLSYNPCDGKAKAKKEFCPQFDWSNTECEETDITETVSEYILNYEIVDTICQPSYEQEQKDSEAFFAVRDITLPHLHVMSL